MKKFKIFLTAAMVVANFIVFAPTTDAKDGAAPTKGKKGTIGGVDTCHCPDDSGECYCNGTINPNTTSE